MIENQSLASKTTSGVTHCQRFLRRGNNPVPPNYEEQEVETGVEEINENRVAVIPEVQPVSDELNLDNNVETKILPSRGSMSKNVMKLKNEAKIDSTSK